MRGDDLADDLAKFIEWPVRYDVDWFPNPRSSVTFRPNPTDGPRRRRRSTTNERGARRVIVRGHGGAVASMGGLREKEDDLADHAAAPHLRKRWKCPACGVTMMAFYQGSIGTGAMRLARGGAGPRRAAGELRQGRGFRTESAGGAGGRRELGFTARGAVAAAAGDEEHERVRGRSETERRSGRKSIPQPQVRSRRARQPVRRRERRIGGRYTLGTDSIFRVREVREDARAHDGWDFEAQKVVPGVEEVSNF